MSRRDAEGMQGLGWTIVIPVKTLIRAKTRLAAAVGPHREDLAVAVAADTVTAALATEGVGRVIVVTADPETGEGGGGAGGGGRPGPGCGAERGPARGSGARHRGGGRPAGRPARAAPPELARVLAAAAEFDQSFLPDAADVGTVLYAVRPGVPFRPRFGGESRARHLGGGAKELCLGRRRLGPPRRRHDRGPESGGGAGPGAPHRRRAPA